jgi:hypothetical protein
MVEIEFDCGYRWMADQLEKYVGPRKFVLHNRIGGEGWDVRPARGGYANAIVIFDDPKMATFMQLKLA